MAQAVEEFADTATIAGIAIPAESVRALHKRIERLQHELDCLRE